MGAKLFYETVCPSLSGSVTGATFFYFTSTLLINDGFRRSFSLNSFIFLTVSEDHTNLRRSTYMKINNKLVSSSYEISTILKD